MLTTVTYHYVHDLRAATFPGLKALDLARFEGQLEYLRGRHSFVTAADVKAFLEQGRPLPPSPCALTFDDGLRDHFTHVFPRLERLGIQGFFYVTAAGLEQRAVLDVHKLHLILAAIGTDELVSRTRKVCREQSIDREEAARRSYVRKSRFGDPETDFIKWFLSDYLDPDSRKAVLGRIFAELFDEQEIAKKLYLGLDEARQMADGGMHFGGHGDTHRRMADLPAAMLVAEVDASIRMVRTIHRSDSVLSFAYPYGSRSDAVEEALVDGGFHFAWATRSGAELGEADCRMRLRRDDTNDFPQPGANE